MGSKLPSSISSPLRDAPRRRSGMPPGRMRDPRWRVRARLKRDPLTPTLRQARSLTLKSTSSPLPMFGTRVAPKASCMRASVRAQKASFVSVESSVRSRRERSTASRKLAQMYLSLFPVCFTQ